MRRSPLNHSGNPFHRFRSLWMVRTQEPTGRNQLGFSHCGVPSIRRSDRDVACFGKTILKNIEQAKLWKLSDTVQIA
ncbi:MAG: hypothetical protein AUH13_26400 [Acidobacteria bacterium 13_2_20CM_58_27]|nr:MAG: hypothetical protein AUH13_26400 [Acidobacteria bacterium 13_2_20CM_58_27]